MRVLVRWEHLGQRRLGVVVDAGRGELAAVAPLVDGDPAFRRDVRPAPADDVVLERALPPVVDHGAVLEGDPAAVRELARVERAQAVVSTMDVFASRGLPGVAVGLEGRDYGIDVAGCERAL